MIQSSFVCMMKNTVKTGDFYMCNLFVLHCLRLSQAKHSLFEISKDDQNIWPNPRIMEADFLYRMFYCFLN